MAIKGISWKKKYTVLGIFGTKEQKILFVRKSGRYRNYFQSGLLPSFESDFRDR